eukprot:SAG31_NODE_46084_length_256_cov_0.643312_1_plen_26_part_01
MVLLQFTLLFAAAPRDTTPPAHVSIP